MFERLRRQVLLLGKRCSVACRVYPPCLACEDCGKRYEEFPLDVVIPDDQWLAIHAGRSGGVLCVNCIVARAAERLPGVTVGKLIFE